MTGLNEFRGRVGDVGGRGGSPLLANVFLEEKLRTWRADLAVGGRGLSTLKCRSEEWCATTGNEEKNKQRRRGKRRLFSSTYRGANEVHRIGKKKPDREKKKFSTFRKLTSNGRSKKSDLVQADHVSNTEEGLDLTR